MKPIDSIIQVTAWFFKKDEQTEFGWLDSLICAKEKKTWKMVTTPWEEITKEIKPDKFRFINKNKNNTCFLEDCIGYEFKITSTGGHEQDEREHICAMEYEVQNAGSSEVFEVELEQLNKIAKRKYEELVNPSNSEKVKIGNFDIVLKQKEIKDPKLITFLTAWYYEGYESFNGESTEYEVDYGMLGEIDISSIKIVEEKKNETASNDEVRETAVASR